MKKILSSVLVVAMMLSMAAMSVSADGPALLWTANLSSEEAWIESYGYEVDGYGFNLHVSEENPGHLVGSGPANQFGASDTDEDGENDAGHVYTTFDIEYDVALNNPEENDNFNFSITYINYNHGYFGAEPDYTPSDKVDFTLCDFDCGLFMSFNYNSEYKAWCLGEGFSPNPDSAPDEEDDPLNAHYTKLYDEPYAMELEEGKTYKVGMSISEGRIRCYVDGVLACEYVDNESIEGLDLKIGAADAATTFPFGWISGCEVDITRIQVGEAGYFYPLQDAPATDAPATDAPATDAPATDAPATDAPATDAPATDAPADTNTGASDDNDSVQTGDISFVVVAAMIVALGSAIIVKKVSVK